MKRIILAALLGGIAMFVWSSIAHMALPLGEAGVRQMKPPCSTLFRATSPSTKAFIFFQAWDSARTRPIKRKKRP